MKKIKLLIAIPLLPTALLPMVGCNLNNECTIKYVLDNPAPLLLKETTTKIKKNTTWGDVSKPTITENTDVSIDNVDTSFVKPTDESEVIKDTEKFTEDSFVKLKVTPKDAISTKAWSTVYHYTDYYYGGRSWGPADFVLTDAGTIEHQNLSALVDYKFSFTVPADQSINYFFIVKHTPRNLPLSNLYAQNLIEVKLDGELFKDYSIKSWSYGGHYLEFNTPIAAGKTIDIQLRLLKNIENTVAVFQKNGQ